MREERLVCVMCPVGCRLTVRISYDHGSGNGEIVVEGYRCNRGIAYGQQEILDPQRILPTSVLVEDGEMELVSVKTNKPVPRRMIFEIMEIVKKTKVKAPVRTGDVIIPNILNTGADVIATRSVNKKV